MASEYWTYNAHYNTYDRVRGHRIIIKPFECLDLFVSPYESNAGLKCFGISEGQTGGIIGRGKRLKDAIRNTRKILYQVRLYSSIATMRELIEMVTARHGQSPRYKEDRS